MEIEPEVLELIKEKIKEGKTESELRDFLKQADYNDAEIEEVFKKANATPEVEVISEEKADTGVKPTAETATSEKEFPQDVQKKQILKDKLGKKPVLMYAGAIVAVIIIIIALFLLLSPSGAVEPEKEEDLPEVDVETGESADLGTLTVKNQPVSAAENSTVFFSIGDYNHSAVVEEITEDSVTIAIFSEVRRITLKVGETEEVDLDGDGEADILVTLTAIENGKAKFKIREVVREQKSLKCTEGEKTNYHCSDSIQDRIVYNKCVLGEWVSVADKCSSPSASIQNGKQEGYCEEGECKVRIICNSGYALESGKCVKRAVLVCNENETQSCTVAGCPGVKTCFNNSWGACVDVPGDNCPAVVVCTAGQTQSCTVAGCPGVKTCFNNSWSACVDVPGDNCPAAVVCTSGQTQSCTINGCPGTKTCSNNAWGACVDVPDDNCPVEGGPITGTAASHPEATILSHNPFIVGDSNYYDIVGEVRNTGAQNHQYIKLEVIFYDAQNNVVSTAWFWQNINIVRVGEKSSFRVKNSNSFHHYALTSSLGTLSATTEEPYDAFEILQHSSRVESGRYYVNAEIKNIGIEDRGQIKVDVSFFNSLGKVVAVEKVWGLSSGLDAGETVVFEVYADTRGVVSPISSYIIEISSIY